MGKQKKYASPGIGLYLKRLREGENNTSELDKVLNLYEYWAKLALILADYMTEEGIWREGYNADTLTGSGPLKGASSERGFVENYSQMKPFEQHAVIMLYNVSTCRTFRLFGSADRLALKVLEAEAHFGVMERWRRSSKGGSWDRHFFGGIREAIAELHEKGYKTAHQMWEHFRVQSIRENPYKTASGVTIYFTRDYAMDATGFLGENDVGPYIRFSTFQGYVTNVRREKTRTKKK